VGVPDFKVSFEFHYQRIILHGFTNNYRYNGFECQLTASNITKVKREYEELLHTVNSDDMEIDPPEDVEMKDDIKEEVAQTTSYGYGQSSQKDEYLDTLAMIDPENYKIRDVDAPDEENAMEVKDVNYYYPMKMEQFPAIIDSELPEDKQNDMELELLHSFFPTNGISTSIEDAKNFLISRKFVSDEEDIDVVRGPFTQYEISVLENEEFTDDKSEPEVVYMKEKQDEEINAIAELLPSKPEFPESGNKQQPPQGQRPGQPGQPGQTPAQPAQEVKTNPEDKAAYEMPSRDIPCLLEVHKKKPLSIDELIAQRYGTQPEEDEERKNRKRQRDEADEADDLDNQIDIVFNDDVDMVDTTKEETKANETTVSEVKKPRFTEADLTLIDITEDNTELRKRTFKTYCDYKRNYEKMVAKTSNDKEKEELGKLRLRLGKGLLINTNKQSKLKCIIDLYLRDKCTYLEKRR